MRKHSFLALAILILLLGAMLVACDPTAPAPQKEGVTIYFITNGGSKVDPITARPGTPITPPPNPVKEGYFFVGWFLNRNATGSPEILPTVMPGKNVTYYAGWTDEGAEVRLDANGGELSTDKFYGAIGANLSELLRDYVPTVEEGVEFAGWYKDGAPLDENYILGIEGVSLQARYKAYYTVNVYKEGLNGVDALDVAESTSELVFVGTARTYAYKTFDGYERTTDLEHTSKTITVGMHPADNVVEVRYDRLRVTVKYLKGGDGAEGNELSFSMMFGADLVLIQNPFTFERHRFAGWRIGSNIFEEGASLSEADISVTDGDRVEITAVWDERFDDVGGGVDVLWALGRDNGHSVELLRENLPLMQGAMQNADMFRVYTSTGEPLSGKLIKEDGKFTWDLGFGSHVERYVVDDNGAGAPHANDYADLNDPFGSEFHIDGQVLKGTFRFDNANGAYVFAEEGGQTLYFSVANIDGKTYFILRENLLLGYSYFDGEDNYELELFENGVLEVYRGVKHPYWLYKEHVVTGSYTKVGDDRKLSAAGTPLDGKTVRVQAYGRSFIVYDESLNGTFSVEGGGSLTLDGFSGASYTDALGEKEDGEFYVVDGDVVFFGLHRSQHFERKGDGFALKGSPEVYRAYISANGAESIVVNGHGKLRYVNSHGRVFYANYVEEEFDGERVVLRFPIDTDDLNYLLFEDVASPVRAEVGAYSHGSETLYLDGMGGAVYDDGTDSFECTYSLRAAAPYDYQLSGGQTFRFILEGKTFKKRNDALAGTFVGKFDPQTTLVLDGYGAATLNENGEAKYYTVSDTDGEELTLLSADLGALNVRLHRADGAEGGTFVPFAAERELNVRRYDFTYFDEEGDNVDENSLFILDGYDGVSFSDGDDVRVGVLDSISDDIYSITLENGDNISIKVFSYPLAISGEKLAFSYYDADWAISLSSADGDALTLDGYGAITLSSSDEESEPIRGFYSLWGTVLTARGGDFSDIAYFDINVSGQTFSRFTDVIVDSGVVKRYIGEGGGVTIPTSATSIGEGAFKMSGITHVTAGRLDGGIGESAFEGCVSLVSFTATAISGIGKRAFYGCKALETISDCGGAADVAEQAFYGCESLGDVVLNGAKTVGYEAFAMTSATVTLSRDLTYLEDRAFAHDDAHVPAIKWTAKNIDSMPAVGEDPFAFDGEGFDAFVIIIDQRSQLSFIYQDAVWSKFAGYLAFENVEPLGEFYDVVTLLKTDLGRISSFDSKRWTLCSEGGKDAMISYDGSLPTRVRELTVRSDATSVELLDSDSSVKYKFVKQGTTLTYLSDDEKTLTLTAGDGDPVIAQFDSHQVRLNREDMTFVLGDYSYSLTLNCDGTFSYRSTYQRKEEGRYANATDGGSELTLYATDASESAYTFDCNYFILGDERYEATEINASFYRKTDDNTLQFYVYVEKSGQYDCYFTQIVLDREAGTYSATSLRKYTGKSYTTNIGSAFMGSVVAYASENEPGVYALVQLIVKDGSQEYRIYAELNNGSVTVSGDYPVDLLRTFRLEFDDRYSTVTVTV